MGGAATTDPCLLEVLNCPEVTGRARVRVRVRVRVRDVYRHGVYAQPASIDPRPVCPASIDAAKGIVVDA